MQFCLFPKLMSFAYYHDNYLLEWKVSINLQSIEILSSEKIDKRLFSASEKRRMWGEAIEGFAVPIRTYSALWISHDFWGVSSSNIKHLRDLLQKKN